VTHSVKLRCFVFLLVLPCLSAAAEIFNWRPEILDELSGRGVEVFADYTNNLAGNSVGGERRGFTFADSTQFGLNLDFKKLAGWDGLQFSASAFDSNGRSLSEQCIGNVFTVQQVYGSETFSFYSLYFEQEFWDGNGSLKAGRFTTGDDFATCPLYDLYMNYGIDSNPQALALIPGFSTSPEAVWGARIRLDPAPDWRVFAGAFQSTTLNLYSGHGFDWEIDSEDGILLIGQVGWSPEIGKSGSGDRLPGNYWFGAFASTPQRESSASPAVHGFYWHADKMLFREKSSGAEGLAAWAVFVLTQPQAAVPVPFQINAGLVYTGPLPGRDEDVLMAGLASGQIADAETGGPTGNGWEAVLEVGYRIQLPGTAFFQPNLQWILQPGGEGGIPNALVLGAQMGVSF